MGVREWEQGDEHAVPAGRRPAERARSAPPVPAGVGPAAAAVLRLQRAAGNHAVAAAFTGRGALSVQRVLVSDPASVPGLPVVRCTVTNIRACDMGDGKYKALSGPVEYRFDGTELVAVTIMVPFGVPTDDSTVPPPGTEVVDIDDDDGDTGTTAMSTGGEEEEEPVPTGDATATTTTTTTTTTAPGSPGTGPKAPWDSPGGTTRARSPGGTTYRKAPPAGRLRSKSRRYAGGYKNPEHGHRNMLPHWEAATASPIPNDVKEEYSKLKKHLMDEKRRFYGTSPGRSRRQVFTGHSGGVLGHEPSASTHWNTVGHTRTRGDNQEHNRSTGAYHGVEVRAWSDASGASEPRYEDPTPDRSHPIWWNSGSTGFLGGPWPSWDKDNPPGTST